MAETKLGFEHFRLCMAEETEYLVSTTVPATATATATAQIPAAFIGCHAHGSDM